jgi:streptogramin lyase
MTTRRDATGKNGRRTIDRRLFLPGRGHWILAAFFVAACSRTLLGQGVTEFNVPYGTTLPRGIAAGADGNIWFADYLGYAIVRMTPAGVFTKFPTLTFDATPVGVTLGPDGNIWFTEYLNNNVARITPKGTMTEFPLPCVNPPYCFESNGPAGITVGPDGNLWIAEAAGKIGRMTTTGAATNFDIPSSKGVPVSIAAGADGNLWFTENYANKIGRITTAGTVTEFPVQTANSTPTGIASGPDGNLWFTEQAGNKIGRITPSGVITEFPIPTAATLSSAIVAGTDGNLWFTESFVNKIGRITTAGVITEFPLPAFTGAFSNGIALGSDSDLWLTRTSATTGRITRFTQPASNASFFTLTPCRLVDTRNSPGPDGGPALAAGRDRAVTLAGGCGIPSGATAVAVNVTVTGATAGGHLTAYPARTSLPPTSTISYSPGQTRANNSIFSLGAGGAVEIHCAQAAGSVQFILDVTGFFK